MFCPLFFKDFAIALSICRQTNQTQEATQEKALWRPRTMHNEGCLFQEYEMAGCHKSWQEANPPGHCWITRSGSPPVWQVFTYTDWSDCHVIFISIHEKHYLCFSWLVQFQIALENLLLAMKLAIIQKVLQWIFLIVSLVLKG